ncbi:MAG: CBS domain-containing protein [Cyanobacteria bacterium P01_F01_bin.33]
MDVILCHSTADFDTLGAAVGAARLYPGARIVLTGGAFRTVREFLGLHRDEFPLIEMRSLHPERIRRLILVDAHHRDRFGNASAWFDLPDVEIHLYDHHFDEEPLGFEPAESYLDAVGSTCTLMVERLQNKAIALSPFEVTALALGIHVDTGSLTFPQSTARDARALAWLMEQGINLTVLASYIDSALTPKMQEVLTSALNDLDLHTEIVRGQRLAVLSVRDDEFVAGLSGVVERLMDLTDIDVLVLVALQGERLSLIGRSRQDFARLDTLMQLYGGGGHSRAASASIRLSADETVELEAWVRKIAQQLRDRIPQPVTARGLMSSPVRTVRPDLTIHEAQRVLLRYGHSGLSVVNDADELVGIVSRRDLDLALHHGFGHAPVKGYMTAPVRTIAPETTLGDIQTSMLKWDIGRLPVLERDRLVGIVTRTDVLRHLHDLPEDEKPERARDRIQVQLKALLPERYEGILQTAARVADELNVRLYVVGGTVRDLLLNRPTDDLDLVVDGLHPLATGGEQPSESEGLGLVLARSLQQHYPETKLEIHGKFQTAALTWPDGLWIDIATARTEFYPYPSALPEVAASSIQQDLYRRDFTINALALLLNGSQAGQILDFFGGLDDLDRHQLRVLHPNSFIEDPTRILRAVRFAVRLQFQLGDRTREYALAAAHLTRDRVTAPDNQSDTVWTHQGTRLKQELCYILRSTRWSDALIQLNDLQALHYLHPDLDLTDELVRQVRQVGAWLYHFARDYPEIDLHHIWQVRLEVMLLPFADALDVARRLYFTREGLQRLQKLPKYRDAILATLVRDVRPSLVDRQLRDLTVSEAILLAAIASKPQRTLIWRYLRDWKRQSMPLTGRDLKQWGYKPSRYFQTILGAVRDRVLDGEMSTADEAEAFVREKFPLESTLTQGANPRT